MTPISWFSPTPADFCCGWGKSPICSAIIKQSQKNNVFAKQSDELIREDIKQNVTFRWEKNHQISSCKATLWIAHVSLYVCLSDAFLIELCIYTGWTHLALLCVMPHLDHGTQNKRLEPRVSMQKLGLENMHRVLRYWAKCIRI